MAKDYNDELIGYALVMAKELEYEIPVLRPMFKKINSLEYGNKELSKHNYFMLGQICVSEKYRRQNIAVGLYNELCKQMKGDFDYIITEVDDSNIPSMRMHLKIGFTVICN